ncbi:FMN reductase [Terrihabitans soli]|uniref:FMN reductase n=1 Tax=Terrihabitans soli TaxID=708113 RepID=A0A6S6R055_9HYPH|nr:NADPH-dependent FMN reductase [Terrihabitans soli]BCJ92348.1 FMN reductase [Terrihabitans soli]
MARLSIGVIVGSARKGSINQKLAEALMKLGGPEVDFKQLKIEDLPLFNQDLEEPVPAPVERFRKEIRASDGLLFITPEYNRSTTPLLLNAISWGSRPYAQSSFAGKPGAIAGTSGGIIRTAAAQAHLRDILGVVGVHLTIQPEAYVHWTDELVAEDGSIPSEQQRELLKRKVDSVVAWVGQVSGSAAKKAA